MRREHSRYGRVVPRVAPPLTEHQAQLIRPLGLLADEPAGTATIERAALLPSPTLDERVGDGWSVIEHLRHLVFVSDAWVGWMVLEEARPYDPIGLPPDFVTDRAEFGLDLDARPSLDAAVAARHRAATRVRDLLLQIDGGDLERACTPLNGEFSVLGALQNVIFEEWAHHQYATRDLEVLAPGW